jgi:hypothetical protein
VGGAENCGGWKRRAANRARRCAAVAWQAEADMGEREEESRFTSMPRVVDKDSVETVGTSRRVQSCGRCLVREKRWGGQLGPAGMKMRTWCRAHAWSLGRVGLGPAKMSVGDLGRFQPGWAAQLRGPSPVKYLFIYSKGFSNIQMIQTCKV